MKYRVHLFPVVRLAFTVEADDMPKALAQAEQAMTKLNPYDHFLVRSGHGFDDQEYAEEDNGHAVVDPMFEAAPGELEVDYKGEHCALCLQPRPRQPTLDERAKARGLRVYDTALPQDWFDKVLDRTHINPSGLVVWSYDGAGVFGEPVAVHPVGDALLAALKKEE